MEGVRERGSVGKISLLSISRLSTLAIYGQSYVYKW